MSFILSILSTAASGLFKLLVGRWTKTPEEKAVETLLAEKTETLESVKDANTTRSRLSADDVYNKRMREKYLRD